MMHGMVRRKWIIGGLCVVAMLVASGAWYLTRSDNTATVFRSKTSTVSAFTPYFFQTVPPHNFLLDNESIDYDHGVLVFRMTDQKSQATLAFTQQALPAGFDATSLHGDKEFKTTYGQGYITDGQQRTTGALLTNDKVWILINAPQPIGADAMHDIMSQLAPAH